MTIPTIIYRAFQRFFQPRERVSPERRQWEKRPRSGKARIIRAADGLVVQYTRPGSEWRFTSPPNIAPLLVRMLKYQTDPDVDWDDFDSAVVCRALMLYRAGLLGECEMGGRWSGK